MSVGRSVRTPSTKTSRIGMIRQFQPWRWSVMLLPLPKNTRLMLLCYTTLFSISFSCDASLRLRISSRRKSFFTRNKWTRKGIQLSLHESVYLYFHCFLSWAIRLYVGLFCARTIQKRSKEIRNSKAGRDYQTHNLFCVYNFVISVIRFLGQGPRMSPVAPMIYGTTLENH